MLWYALKLPHQGNSNEHQQRMFLWVALKALWTPPAMIGPRTVENNPLIVIKYPPYMYLFLCTRLVNLVTYIKGSTPSLTADWMFCKRILSGFNQEFVKGHRL